MSILYRWDSDMVDLPAYFRRINMPMPSEDTDHSHDLTLLHLLHRAHVTTLPFDNIDFILDRPVSLQPADIVDKLCHHARGGACHEQNLLFASVLERLGYRVDRLAARVILGGVGPRPRTHLALRVVAGGQPWLCDVGFGAGGFYTPIILDEDCPVENEEYLYRITAQDSYQWRAEVNAAGDWATMYQFSLERCDPIDVTVAHHYLSTHPHSMLRRTLFLQRLTPGLRLTLRGNNLTRITDGCENHSFVRPADLGDALNEFGITLADFDLAALRQRMKFTGGVV
jgi:N-hydroxyarylamine O-acetyltransferase